MNQLVAPERRILKKMGFLKDQKGILNRYFRETLGWQDHLDKCREFILQELNSRKTEQIWVLGSGWLLDFPLDEALDLCGEIFLIDVSHPAQIKLKAGKNPKINLLKADLTGSLITDVFNLVQASGRKSIKPDLTQFNFNPEFELPSDCMVISLNVMNQLDILLVDYLKKFWDFQEEEILDFRKKIQEAHINLIKRNDAILITDYIERQIGIKGELTTENKLIYANLPVPLRKQQWTWKFDTQDRYIVGKDVEMEVQAISF